MVAFWFNIGIFEQISAKSSAITVKNLKSKKNRRKYKNNVEMAYFISSTKRENANPRPNSKFGDTNKEQQ